MILLPKGEPEAENTTDVATTTKKAEVKQQSSGVGQRSDSKNEGITTSILTENPWFAMKVFTRMVLK